jgi:hypothetical protein
VRGCLAEHLGAPATGARAFLNAARLGVPVGKGIHGGKGANSCPQALCFQQAEGPKTGPWSGPAIPRRAGDLKASKPSLMILLFNALPPNIYTASRFLSYNMRLMSNQHPYSRAIAGHLPWRLPGITGKNQWSQ